MGAHGRMGSGTFGVFHFQPRGSKGLDLLAYLKQLKIWNNGFQDTGPQSTKDRDPQTQQTNKMAASSCCLERVSQPQCRVKEHRQILADSLRWGDRTESRETKAARTCRAQCWRGESHTEKGLQRSAESLPQVFSRVLRSTLYARRLPEPEEEAPERIRGAEAHIGPGIVLVIQSDWTTSQITEHWAKYSEGLASVVGDS